MQIERQEEESPLWHVCARASFPSGLSNIFHEFEAAVEVQALHLVDSGRRDSCPGLATCNGLTSESLSLSRTCRFGAMALIMCRPVSSLSPQPRSPQTSHGRQVRRH